MNSNVNRDTHTGARSARRPSIGPRRRHSRPRNHVGFASDVTTNEILGFFFVCLFSLFLVFFLLKKKRKRFVPLRHFAAVYWARRRTAARADFLLFFLYFCPRVLSENNNDKNATFARLCVCPCVCVRVCKRERKKERKKGRTPSSRP